MSPSPAACPPPPSSSSSSSFSSSSSRPSPPLPPLKQPVSSLVPHPAQPNKLVHLSEPDSSSSSSRPPPSNSPPAPEVIASIITQVSASGLPSKPMAFKKKKKKKSPASALSPAPPSPSASRDGTHHTIATTAEQTLVDEANDKATPSSPDPTLTDSPLPHSRPGPDYLSPPQTSPPPTSPEAPRPSSARLKKSNLSQRRSPPSPSNLTQSPPPPGLSTPKPPVKKNSKRDKNLPRGRKFFKFLLPCFHSTSHDDDHRFQSSLQKTSRSTPPVQPCSQNPTRQEAIQPEMAEARSQRTHDGSHPKTSNSTTPHSRRSPRHQGRRSGSASASPERSSSSPTPVSDTTTPAGAAVATSVANAGGAGVQLPLAETEGILSGAVVPPGKDLISLKKKASAKPLEPDEIESEESFSDGDQDHSEEEDDEEDRIVAMGGMGIPVGEDGVPRPLLGALDSAHSGRKCLVLDLDETLVHSSFKVIPHSDFVVPVEIENLVHNVYVIKRPGVDEFMRRMGALYEIVVFTASLSKYADPVLDMLDIHKVVTHRLFRESCYNHKGNYVKDLSQLGRPIADTIIIDNSPASYIFHPNNAVPVSSWFNDPHDTELTDLAAFLTDIANVPDVRGILDSRL